MALLYVWHVINRSLNNVFGIVFDRWHCWCGAYVYHSSYFFVELQIVAVVHEDSDGFTKNSSS